MIRQTAIGVNFADSMRLADNYPGPALPAGLGYEGAGVVEAVGPGVEGFAVRDRLAALGGGFSYADRRVVPANRSVRLPEAVPDVTAGASFLKGLTAGALAEGAYPIQPGGTLVRYGSASGPAPPMDETLLASKGGLKAVSASFFTYIIEDAAFARISQALLDKLASGAITVDIEKTYPLEDAAAALADIVSRETMGALVVTI